MSGLKSDVLESGMFSGKRPLSEKPGSFSRRRGLLGQYLNEKRTFGNRSPGLSFDHEKGMPVAATPSTATSSVNTMSLFPTMVPSDCDSTGVLKTRAPPMSRDLTAMDLFPQHSGFGPGASTIKIPKRVDHSVNKPEPEEVSRMTVFYGGRVFLFNDIPADKAKEITNFARKASHQVPSTSVSAPFRRLRETANTVALDYVNNLPVERLSSPLAIDVADLPIARKASLTRFLEKRKDRISTRVPYQKRYSIASLPKGKKQSRLGLSPQPTLEQFERQS